MIKVLPKPLNQFIYKKNSFFINEYKKYVMFINSNINIKISKLAQGLPVGGEIEFLDDGTLFSAFKNRGPVVSD